MKWLDKLPLTILAFFATLLALAPFGKQPHLWGKIQMLLSGNLTRPIDIFDLFLHGSLLGLLLIKIFRVVYLRMKTKP